MPETTPPTRSPATDPPPPGVEALLDRVFISPRIVDQRTFEEFAGGLRTLVRDASSQEKSLREAGVEVKVLSDQLREASRELAARVERAAPTEAPPALDDDAMERRVRSVVARVIAAELESQRETFRGSLREIAREAAESARRSPVAPSASAGPANVSEHARDAGLLRRVEETLTRVREAHAALDGAADSTVIRVAALADQVQAAAARLEAGKEGLTRLAADVDARGEALRGRAQDLDASDAQARARAEDSAREIGVQLAAALGEAERRARLISTGLDAELADAAIRARSRAGAQAGAPTHALDQARRVGEGLSRLIAEANIIGPALDRLIREAKAFQPPPEPQRSEPAV